MTALELAALIAGCSLVLGVCIAALVFYWQFSKRLRCVMRLVLHDMERERE